MPTAITPEEIQHHMREFLSQVNLRILVTGNMYKDVREWPPLTFQKTALIISLQEAVELADIAEYGLGIAPCSSVELNDRALILPQGVWGIVHRTSFSAVIHIFSIQVRILYGPRQSPTRTKRTLR